MSHSYIDDVYQYLKKNVKVIGLSGVAGSGKDYIAKRSFVNQYGFYNIAFAWHMKINCVAFEYATYDEIFHTKPPHVRKLLQLKGTEEGRDVYGQDIWVDTTFSWMMLFHEQWGIDKFVIPDVRFKNELYGIQEIGGKVYRVINEANGRILTEEAKQHRSEITLTDEMNIYNGHIFNNSNSTDYKHIELTVNSIMEEMLDAEVATMD